MNVVQVNGEKLLLNMYSEPLNPVDDAIYAQLGSMVLIGMFVENEETLKACEKAYEKLLPQVEAQIKAQKESMAAMDDLSRQMAYMQEELQDQIDSLEYHYY